MTVTSDTASTNDSPPVLEDAGVPESTLTPDNRTGHPLVRWLRRPPGDPTWARPALVVLLLATAVLYLWGLGASGWANSFYSAAVQAGSESWKAFFYGSSDAGNSITVDKTPASLWLMALSVRIFGLSSWSILVPEALAGVAAVGVLYATLRRWFGPAAGLLAGAVMALTPVAVLMFRFNNPDALLILLLVAGAYATTRAIETASTRWLAFVGVLVGFGFLTKMLQALLVVPAFALAYLVAAPTGLWRRIRQLLVAGAAMIVAAGWWIAIVELVPASARPYIGGSQNNSILELALGYNGLGRLTGNEVGSVGGGGAGGPGAGAAPAGAPVVTQVGPGGGPGGGGGWGQTGLLRMFEAESGGQVSWLLPAALLLLVAVLALTWRAARTDRTRAAIVLWGGWLVVTGLTFSLMAGIFHAYYEVALAPAIGAVVAIGAVYLWRRKDLVGSVLLAIAVAGTTAWAFVLLGRTADWQSWLRPAVLAVGVIAALAIVAVRVLGARLSTMVTTRRAVTTLALTAGAFAVLAGPAAYAVDTAATPHTGSIPTAGPAGGGGPGGFPGGGGPRQFVNGQFPGGGANGGAPRFGGPGTGLGGQAQGPNVQGGPNAGGRGGPGGVAGGFPGANGAGRGPGGGMGGLLDAATPNTELVKALQKDADKYTWAAASIGSNNAAGLQLGSGEPVMPIGGFNGSDPSPTLAQFQQYVKEGKIHYFIGGDGFMSNGGSRASSDIGTWVQANFTATTIGGTTVYDLSRQAG